MTIEEVEAEVVRIGGIASDDEAAHSAEDDLWEGVLRAIAEDDAHDPQGLAKAALKTKGIKFARWCA